MNLNLSGSTQSNTAAAQNTAATSAANAAGSVHVQGNHSANLNSGNYNAGQVFSGEVAEINGKDILILLGNHQTISARMEGDISLTLGQSVYFEVQSNKNNQMFLRPLYTNLTSADPAVLKALDAAGLPVNEKTIGMTSAMMEEGMPVNKHALQEMFRQVNSFQNVDTKTLVQMTKLQLPITESNVAQFEKYQNLEHQILKDVNNLTDGIPKLIGELTAQGNTVESYDLNRQLLDILTAGREQLTEAASSQADVTAGGQAVDALAGSLAEQAATGAQVTDQVVTGAQTTAQAGISDTALQELTPEQRQSLAEHLENLGLSQEGKAQLLNGQMTTQQVYDFLKEALAQPEAHHNEHLKTLLQSDAYQNLLKSDLTQQWLLKPEDVAKEGRVEELYRRISEQSQKILQALQNTAKPDATLVKSAGNMQDNVNFMNQLNQMLSYVQLPLKMSQENAHGDLYVYTNKKNLAAKDGNVSALLHLEMETLGTMDIHVAMQQNKVSTHFYLQKEEMLDFIEANIHLLNERLTKKGYQMKTSVSVKETEETNVVEEFLHGNGAAIPPGAAGVAKYSFDVRA
ncbi:MAG TPA: flagellar hook-length control protein FliK [Lachnospiraceae bacterium]|nr:flagellar hook-length control protein FliK [Lachnospiraceae bacterium]